MITNGKSHISREWTLEMLHLEDESDDFAATHTLLVPPPREPPLAALRVVGLEEITLAQSEVGRVDAEKGAALLPEPPDALPAAAGQPRLDSAVQAGDEFVEAIYLRELARL